MKILLIRDLDSEVMKKTGQISASSSGRYSFWNKNSAKSTFIVVKNKPLDSLDGCFKL